MRKKQAEIQLAEGTALWQRVPACFLQMESTHCFYEKVVSLRCSGSAEDVDEARQAEDAKQFGGEGTKELFSA